MGFSSCRLSGNPWPAKERNRRRICVELRTPGGEEASEERTGDGCLTSYGNTPFPLLSVWQKNKHKATAFSLSAAQTDERWLISNETRCPGDPNPTLVLWFSGPTESLPQLLVLNHMKFFCPMTSSITGSRAERPTLADQHLFNSTLTKEFQIITTQVLLLAIVSTHYDDTLCNKLLVEIWEQAIRQVVNKPSAEPDYLNQWFPTFPSHDLRIQSRF